MRDVVVVGAGLAGLSAAWRLRDRNIVVLEADSRFGGRITSETRGRYWMNWGGHVFAGRNTATDALLTEVGVEAATLTGSLQGVHLNGQFIPKGSIWTYPFRLPMSPKDRLATMRTGTKVLAGVARYNAATRRRPGESSVEHQQRIYDFENTRTFQEYIGKNPRDAASLFEVTVTRSSGDMDQISAGSGLGYFNLVLGLGEGLNRGILGGPSTLTSALAARLGDRLQLGSRVQEIVHRKDSVLVRYLRDGVQEEVEAHAVVLATTADVAHRVGVDLPDSLREALGTIKYGPWVSSAFLTAETEPQRWDGNYAIATPGRSFAIVLNQASLIRSQETTRAPGGSIMVFSPASLGRALIELEDEEVQHRHLQDLDVVLGPHFSGLVSEAGTRRWSVGGPYCFPGRARLQETIVRGGDRVFLAGDYTGTLYTESAIGSGFAAAQRAQSLLTS